MPAFSHKFAELVIQKRQQFLECFSEEAVSPAEALLKRRILENWHPLPEEAIPAPRPAFAVDGSQASRGLASGGFLAICQALMIGPGCEECDVALELVRGCDSSQELDRFVDLLRQRLELGLALRHIARAADGTLFLDGTLHGQMRIRGPLHIKGFEKLPESVIGTYLALLAEAERYHVLALGVSKTSRESLLSRCLLDGSGLSEVIPDSEMLFRWTRGPGFTTPVVLGRQELEDAEAAMKLELGKSPAVVAFHVRLAPGEDTLRIDLPASWLGLPDRVADLNWRFAEPSLLFPVLSLLRDAHGGLSVYNAMLYIVDKQVRLSERTLSRQYLPIIRRITGKRVELDRSRRRFL